jgi:hypothetical protein
VCTATLWGAPSHDDANPSCALDAPEGFTSDAEPMTAEAGLANPNAETVAIRTTQSRCRIA